MAGFRPGWLSRANSLNPWFAYLEAISCVGQFGRTFRPVHANDSQPFSNPLPEIAGPAVGFYSELAGQTVRPKKRNQLSIVSADKTPPTQPGIKIETAGIVYKSPHNGEIHRHRMLLNFFPESFTQKE